MAIHAPGPYLIVHNSSSPPQVAVISHRGQPLRFRFYAFLSVGLLVLGFGNKLLRVLP